MYSNLSLCNLEKTFYIVGKCFSNIVLEWGAALEVILSVFDIDISKGEKNTHTKKSKPELLPRIRIS